MPAVISGSGSVFGTAAAADWLALLEALEQPSHPARARSAALTPLLGWTAHAAGERQRVTARGAASAPARLGAHAARAGRRDARGVDPRRRADAPRGCSRRSAASAASPTSSTSPSCCNAAAGAEQFGVAALTGWLRQRIDAADREGSNDERTRRLDSDADAVQVLTFHRSKGLEFPVVYCPFLWEAGRLADEGQPVYFHDDEGRRAIDVGLGGDEYGAHLNQHNVEERGEELRLAYVALTRARHQAVIWWASGWYAQRLAARAAAVRPGRGRQRRLAGVQASARGRRARSASARSRRWRRTRSRSSRRGSAIACAWRPELDADAELGAARFDRRIDTAWRRTSYSALTAAAHDAIVASEPEEAGVTDEPDVACRARSVRAAALGDGQRPAARHADPPGAAGDRLRRARPERRARGRG